MIIEKYGIKLISLQREDIELVREKRNHPKIQKRMFYQKEITKEEQLIWFNNINPEKEFYCIVQKNKEKIGLVQGRVKSFKNKIAEGGMFIWDTNYINTHIPTIASLCTNDFSFSIIGMLKSDAKVRADNPKAINYNLSLGYKIIEQQRGTDKVIMQLTKESHIKASQKIRKIVKKISGETTNLSLKDITYTEGDFLVRAKKKLDAAQVKQQNRTKSYL